MPPIKVCQVIPTLVQGGAEKQMALLAEHLDRGRFECHVVVLTHSGPLESKLRESGIRVHVVGKRGKLDPTALFRLTAKLREIRPEIVHTWLFAANSYGRAAAHRARVPIIIAAERCVDPWKSWWHHWIDRRLLRITDTIATNSLGVCEFYERHGLKRKNFTVIPNAVSAEKTAPKLSKAELFQRLKLEPRKMVVGAVGRLWPQKGYSDLMWSAELLRVALQDVWFVIVGDGPDRKKLLEYRDKIQAHRAVRFVGHREDAAELMSAFDLLWNGSRYEGQSNTIMEAMRHGVPVVASDIPGNRDLVLHDQTGCLLPLGDIDQWTRTTFALLNDEERRQSMGRQAKVRIENEFSLEKMILGYTDLYNRMLENKRKKT